jgi:hypothetical protein
MNSHLSDAELTDHLLGVASKASEMHLQSCPTCRTELTRVSESIQLFRTAAIDWSVDQASGQKPDVLRERAWLGRPPQTARWAVAGALVCFALVLGLLFGNYHLPRWQASSPSGTAADRADFQTEIEKDNELLSHLNSELSKSVPAPMQPLQISLVTQTEKGSR